MQILQSRYIYTYQVSRSRKIVYGVKKNLLHYITAPNLPLPFYINFTHITRCIFLVSVIYFRLVNDINVEPEVPLAFICLK